MSTLRTNEIKMLDDRGAGSFTFDSVADLKEASKLKVGQKVRTLGYYSPGDGGGNDYEIVAAGTGANFGFLYEQIAGSGLEAKLLGGGVMEDKTVFIPTDYPTLQEAIDDLSKIRPTNGATIGLMIESGHSPASGIFVHDGDYSTFVIQSEDLEVAVSDNFSKKESLIRGENCLMPTLDCLVNGNGLASSGYSAVNSKGLVTPSSGLKNSWGTALNATSGSSIDARNTVWTGAAVNGNTSSAITANNSFIDAAGADCSDSNYYGVQATNGGSLHFHGGLANNAVRYGIRATNMGIIECRYAQANDCGVNGIRSFSLGIIHAREANSSRAGSYGVTSSRGSLLYFQDGTATECGASGAHSADNSLLNIKGANVRRVTGSDSSDDILNGGFVIKDDNTLGGCINADNTFNESGVYLNTSQNVYNGAVALNASVEDWGRPTGQKVWNIIPNANNRVIGGILGSVGGDYKILRNYSDSDCIGLVHESTGSLAENRFNFQGGEDVYLLPGESATLRYHNSRWTLESHSGGQAFPVLTVATLPAHCRTGSVAFVTDAAGGSVLAFIDENNDWRRIDDRSVIS